MTTQSNQQRKARSVEQLMRHPPLKQKSLEQPLPYELSQCQEQQADCFYFSHIQPRLAGYWTDELASLYLKASSSSILSKAASAFTCSITSLHPRYSHFKPLALKKYSECLRLVGQAINDPKTIKADETLVAVLLLGTYEVGPVAPSTVIRLKALTSRRYQDH